MTATRKSLPANGALLRAARLQLGRGTLAIARAAGSSFTTINSIEKNNAITSALTLAEVRKIAEAAGLTITDLLTVPRNKCTSAMLADPDRQHGRQDQRDIPAQDPSSEPTDPAADAKTLAQVLITDTRMITKVAICRTLQWTFPRLNDAAEHLDAQLPPVGLRVHQLPDKLCLRPIDADAHTVAAQVQILINAERGMTVTTARLVRDAIIANVPDEIRDGEKPFVGALTAQGILRPGKRGEPSTVATDATLYAFDIDGVSHIDMPVAPTWTSQAHGDPRMTRKSRGGGGGRRGTRTTPVARRSPDDADG